MPRVLIACVVAVLLGPQSGFAQTTVTTARTIQSGVLLSDPRGDSALIIAVPPGVVLEVSTRSGDWYRARTIGSVERVGWIHRTVIELLPADARASLSTAASAGSDAAPQAPQAPREEISRASQSDFRAGHTELIVVGGMAGWNTAGETVGVFQIDSLVGFVAAHHLEVVASTSLFKASGADAFGSFGGGLFANLRDRGPVVPFVGGVIGRGFGASSLFDGLVDDPTFLNASGGFRVLMRGGGGALIVRPFYERYFNSSDVLPIADVNRFGVSIGASILF
jgi:hypothetical protein